MHFAYRNSCASTAQARRRLMNTAITALLSLTLLLTMHSMGMTSMSAAQWSLPELSPSAEPPKGFPKEILNVDNSSLPIDNKLLCSHCQLVLRRPVQGPCGHRFCAGCIAYLIRFEHRVSYRLCILRLVERHNVRQDPIVVKTRSRGALNSSVVHCRLLSN